MKYKKTKKQFQKAIQNAGVPIYRDPRFATIVVFLASVCDFLTIYSAAEYYLSEKVVINIAVTVAIAFILNYIPALLGNAVADKDTKNRKLLICVLTVAFILLFSMSFALRWSSRSMMFEDVSSLALFNENVDSSAEIARTLSAAENTLALVIGSSTLFTSLLSFVFSLLALTKTEMAERLRERRIVELDNEIADLESRIAEISSVIENNNNDKLDEEKYKFALEYLETDAAILKEDVKIQLATLLADPKTISIVLNRDKKTIYA